MGLVERREGLLQPLAPAAVQIDHRPTPAASISAR